MSIWKFVWSPTADERGHHARLFDVGINDDGTLHNPNGYAPELVLAAIGAATARRDHRRFEAAAKAAATRRRRREKRVHEAAARIDVGPRQACYVCGRGLADEQSIDRGIGPECWQDVLELISR